MEKKYSAIHVGESGFPFGSAGVNKCIALYKALQREGIDVLIINNIAVHKRDIPIEIKKDDIFENLRYVYTTPSQYLEDTFLKRKWSNIVGRYYELKIILKKIRKKEVDVLIYYPRDWLFFDLLYYRLISKIFKKALVCHSVESWSTLMKNERIDERIDSILFDKYFMRFVDGVLPISDSLILNLKKANYKGPYLKVPPICDFKLFNAVRKGNDPEKYFLFTASSGHKWAIEFVIKSFEKLNDESAFLHLVISGNDDELDILRASVDKNHKKDKIIIMSKLSYEDLICEYKNAIALLIPLANNIKDNARFPQKVSEYLASGNPVITTNSGEICNYFTDGKNAFISQSFSYEDFAAKMKLVIENPDEAQEIGRNGYQTGLNFFDIDSYRKPLKEFIIQVCN